MESGVSAQTYPKPRDKSVWFLILTASQLRIYGRKPILVRRTSP